MIINKNKPKEIRIKCPHCGFIFYHRINSNKEEIINCPNCKKEINNIDNTCARK